MAEGYIQQLTDANLFEKPIVTTLEPLTEFFVGEGLSPELRGQPIRTSPYIMHLATPKVEKGAQALRGSLEGRVRLLPAGAAF